MPPASKRKENKQRFSELYFENRKLRPTEDRELLQKKLEALNEGIGTDFSFLVGEEGKTELVHCFKMDLILASEYFKNLVQGPKCSPPPVRMKHHKPHIFKNIIRYITFMEFEEVSSIEDTRDLIFAADEFMLEKMRAFYQPKLKNLVTVNNVWATLNTTLKRPELATFCSKVLRSSTEECLKHPTFMQASEESLIYFLKLKDLRVESEMVLIDACLRWASSLSQDERLRFMKSALPHLRILTLTADQLPKIAPYLNTQEKMYVSTRLVFGDDDLPPIKPYNINPAAEPWKPIPKSGLLPGPVVSLNRRVAENSVLPGPSGSQAPPSLRPRTTATGQLV